MSACRAGIIQMVVTADDVRDAHVVIINHHRQHVGWRSIAAEQDKIIKVFILKDNTPLNDVLNDRLAFEWRFQSNGR